MEFEMKVLLYLAVILAITIFLFASHYLTSYYTYTLIGGLKQRNYTISFFSSGIQFWFWIATTLFSLFYVVFSSWFLLKGGAVDFSQSGSLAWLWYTLAGLGLVVPIYHFGAVLINLAHKMSIDQFGVAYPSVLINLVLIVGIVVYNMYKIVGERPNKYVWATITFALVTAIFATLSIKQYVK